MRESRGVGGISFYKLIVVLVVIVFMAIVIFGGILPMANWFTGGGPRIGINLPSLHLPQPTESINISQPSVVLQVRSLSQLETVHYTIEKVIEGKSTKGFPLTGDNILFVAHGEVVAGIDLSQIKDQDVVISGTTVIITLPPSKLLYTRLDNNKSHVYNRSTDVFGGDPNLETQVRSAAEEQIKQAALEDGILAKSDQTAQDDLRKLLTAFGYTDIQFKIATPTPVPFGSPVLTTATPTH